MSFKNFKRAPLASLVVFLITTKGSLAFADVNTTLSCDIVPNVVIIPPVRILVPPIVIVFASNVPLTSTPPSSISN